MRSRGQIAQESPMATNFCRINPHGGQRSCRGHPGSSMGQIAYECAMVTKFDSKNSWPECKGSCSGRLGQSDTNCPETYKPANVANVASLLPRLSF